MVVADRANRVEVAQIVLIWRVVTVPCNDVERRVTDIRPPQVTIELRDEFKLAFPILERRLRGEKVTRVRETIRADWPKIGEVKQRAEVFADVTARSSIRQCHGKAHATRNDGNLERLQLDDTQLRCDRQAAFLRHDQ